ncbi:MAG: type II toxin-antitoxin system HicB family antitoxin [Spirochaetota bacterium]|nr:type II toxin-antitoxin system HicB family antitoxin [Spirochaetota bacterium]
MIHKAEEGGYWAEVPALPGCVSQGESYDETLSNIQEAMEGWLLSQNDIQTTDDNDKVVEVII